MKTETEELSYFIDQASEKSENVVEIFEFLGMFLAKAIWDKIPLNLCLNRMVIKFLLGDADCDLEDLKFFDSVHYNSLRYINENTINEDPLIEQYFVYENGNGDVHELAVGGGEIKVTDENKMQYTLVKAEHMTKDCVIDQLTSLKNGFNALIPHSKVKNFTVSEFETLLGGQQ